jgi:aryl-alcohol dehydrogenase-like predicted oxidoreductase
MKRRPFVKAISLPAISASVSAAYWNEAEAAALIFADRPMPRRHYKEGIELSIIGFGGIVLMGQEQPACNNEVARAVGRGINYFDVAPSYGKGEAEQKLGPALKPWRDQVFLACKTGRRDAAGAREELENSLKTLQTDHFDLYQLHNMHTPDDIEKAFAPGGVMELMVKARDEGKIRHLGFSAHDEDVALELLDRFEWDSVLFPVNYVCFANSGFGPRLLEKAKKKKVARLALKALAHTPWDSKEQKKDSGYSKCWYRPIDDLELVRKAFYFTLSQDVTSAIPPGAEQVYRMAENLAAGFQPLEAEERRALLASAQGLTPLFPRP